MSRCIGKNNHKHSRGRLGSLLILFLLVAAGLYSSLNALRSSKTQYQAQLASALNSRGADIWRFHQNGTRTLIAHGGGVGPCLYANSQEAVIGALDKGFTFIELDLLKTKDEHLLAAHDWDTFCTLTGTATQPDTLNEALSLRIAGSQTPLSGSMIVEVFSPQDYVRALSAGILYPAFCISHSIALQQALEHRYPLVTISVELFQQHFDTMRQLHQQKVCIMVYGTEGLDAATFIREHAGTNASMIYTSSVSPDNLN